jgi:hypothetical protein
MIVVYGRLEGSPPCVTMVTQQTSVADRWYEAMKLRERMFADQPAHQDVLIVEFPDQRREAAVEFLSWMHHKPRLFEITAALAQDGIVWKMWSVENDPKNVMRTDYRENYHHIYEGAEAALNFGKNPCGENYKTAESRLNFGLPTDSHERRRASDKKEDQNAEWANFMKSIGAEDK